MKRPEIPTQIQISNVALGSHGSGFGGVYVGVDANVTFHIEGDTGGVFRVVKVETDDVVITREAPHGQPIVSLETALVVNGPGPIKIFTGEAILATVEFTCPADPPRAEFRATAVMNGPGLPAPIGVPIVATANLGTLQGFTLFPPSIHPGATRGYGFVIRSTIGHGVPAAVRYNASLEKHFSAPIALVVVPAQGTVTSSVHLTCASGTRPGLYTVTFEILSQDLSQDFSSFQFVVEVIASTGAGGIDDRLTWEQPAPFAIQLDANADGWNSGRVHDVISLPGGSLLAGVAKGGVWAVTASAGAIPHSNAWDNPDVNCLARGLDDSNHFYAGCDSGGALYESEPNTAFLGFMTWHLVPVVDTTGRSLDPGNVLRIAVIQQNRKLVLACQNGVFWANIPPIGGIYVFKQASSLPSGTYSGVTPGPNGSVVVGAWGDGKTRFGIFFGDWSSGDLVFRRMIVPNESSLNWISLASCDGDLNRMYAAGSNSNGNLISVLRHDHSKNGMTWLACDTTAVAAPPGKDLLNSCGDASFGGWIKTLRVSPTKPDVVVINWARTFINFGGGGSPWIAVDQVPGPAGSTDWIRTPAWSAHMHEDGHATVFDVGDERILYIATDGGVGMTPDLGKTYFSKYNERLTTLMFESQPSREGSYGTLSAGPFPTGLLAAGLQDNGDVYCQLAPTPGPWQRMAGGDGMGVQFLPVGQRLIWYVNDNTGVKASRWDGSRFVDTAVIPRADEFPLQDGLKNPVMEVVAKPHFRDASGRLMVAVGCASGSGDIYGLFTDDGGGDPKWQSIGFLPPFAQGNVTAIGSLSGDSIWIGTSEGRIFSMGAKSGSAFEFTTPRGSTPGEVDRFVVVSDQRTYAIYNTQAGQGLVLQQNAFTWDPLGSNSDVAKGAGLPKDEGLFFAMAIDRDALPHTLFVASDKNVYDSRDDAETWQLASNGLPRQPHCTDLRVDRGDGQNRFLYLTTFGRSVWRTPLK